MRFVDRLHEIVDNCIISKLGEWKLNETVFYIYNISDFENFIKPYSFSTFKRQLKLYDFTVCYSSGGMTFKHPDFNKDSKNDICSEKLQKRKQIRREKRKLCREKRKRFKKGKTTFNSSIEERVENVAKKLKTLNEDIAEVSKLKDILDIINANKLQDFLNIMMSPLSSPIPSPIHTPSHLEYLYPCHSLCPSPCHSLSYSQCISPINVEPIGLEI